MAKSQTLALILESLSQEPDPLPLLRRLRNLCAGDLANQTAFVESDGQGSIFSLLRRKPEPDVLRVGLQLLGNVAMAGEAHRAAVWAAMFPGGFALAGRLRDKRIVDPLCMVLDTCCSAEGGRRRLEEICGDDNGLMVVVDIIATAARVGYEEEWLEWFLTKLSIEEPYFRILFLNLSILHESDAEEFRKGSFTTGQASLLCILSKCLIERPHELTVSTEFALTILDIMKEAANAVDFALRSGSELPTAFPSLDVLGYSLLILRDICAWEDSNSSPLAPVPPVNLLISAGILETVLNLLRELEPPLIVKKSIEKANDPEIRGLATEAKKVCPYKGYRRDLVSVIANCLHGRKEVQDEMREKNAIMLLLQQCVVDEENPFLREWGLLAVRNLLEGNLENQQEVGELQLQGAVDTPEIDGLGLRVEVDEKTGRVKLRNNA